MGGIGRTPDPDEGPAPPAGGDGARPPATDERYRCSHCGRAVETEDVVRIDAEHRWSADGGAPKRRRTGYVLVAHRCPCSARVVVSRRPATYAGFVALFGRGVRLPYLAPFTAVELGDDDPLLRRWRWELDQVDGVEDFVMWVDAERRKAADELRRRLRAPGDAD